MSPRNRLFGRMFLTPRGEMMSLPQRGWSEGLGIGAAYGLIRPALGDISRLRAEEELSR